jgi:ribosomal protein L37AE/L43A
MAHSPSPPQATTALLDAEQDVSRFAACPLCHTPAALTRDALEAGGSWRCLRCGQHWDGARLAAIATYDAWVVEHDSVRRGRDTAGQRATASGDPGAAGKHSPRADHADAISAWDNEGGPPSGPSSERLRRLGASEAGRVVP